MLNGGLFLSTNYGSNWTEDTTSKIYKFASINILTVSGTKLYAGTFGASVWNLDLNSLSAENDITPLSPHITCYPNPASNSLTIDLSSPFFLQFCTSNSLYNYPLSQVKHSLKLKTQYLNFPFRRNFLQVVCTF